MSVNNINGNNYDNYSSYLSEKNKPISQQNTEKKAEESKTTDKNSSVDGDKYVASSKTEYKTDTNKVASTKAEMESKVESFRKMISSMFQKQGSTYNKSVGIRQNLEDLIASGGVSNADKLEAQQAISEDGEWGVEKTAGRILDFAKALSGGDPSKIELLKNAVMKGFKDAEKAWGGKLPDISQKTIDRVMEGFDEWEKSAGTSSTAAEA